VGGGAAKRESNSRGSYSHRGSYRSRGSYRGGKYKGG